MTAIQILFLNSQGNQINIHKISLRMLGFMCGTPVFFDLPREGALECGITTPKIHRKEKISHNITIQTITIIIVKK